MFHTLKLGIAGLVRLFCLIVDYVKVSIQSKATIILGRNFVGTPICRVLTALGVSYSVLVNGKNALFVKVLVHSDLHEHQVA